jgi:hypothetical protein
VGEVRSFRLGPLDIKAIEEFGCVNDVTVDLPNFSTTMTSMSRLLPAFDSFLDSLRALLGGASEPATLRLDYGDGDYGVFVAVSPAGDDFAVTVNVAPDLADLSTAYGEGAAYAASFPVSRASIQAAVLGLADA